MNIQDFYLIFPNNAVVLDSIESSIHNALQSSKYSHSIKLIDSFIYLFSDDLKNTSYNINTNDLVIVLYSEAFKRIRTSYLLSLRGYFIDCAALLRSVYELNKAIRVGKRGSGRGSEAKESL